MNQVQIPAVKLFKKKLGHKNAWADHYGGLHVAADYCGVKIWGVTFRGVWQHGCFGPWDNHTPALLTYHAPDAESRSVFVARKDHVQALQDSGYSKVHSIGLPFVYLPKVNVARRNNSLLVVPIHTLAGIPFETTQELNDYADFIKKTAVQFTEIKVCVHPGCLENDYWFKQFAERGIDCIVGARTDDANALLRMKMLFSQFDFVTTNGWGSHVAYALFCGAKVSIWGPIPSRDLNASLTKDVGWGGSLDAIKKATSIETKKAQDECLQRFYLFPKQGVKDEEFGRWLLGADNKLAPSELKRLFGWSLPACIVHLLSMKWLFEPLRRSMIQVYRKLLHLSN